MCISTPSLSAVLLTPTDLMNPLQIAYKGCARIALTNLHSASIRQPNAANVDRLRKVFASQGCNRGNPENFVIVLIDQQLLHAVLTQQNLPITDLTCNSPPLLNFSNDVKLECLHGGQRLQAAASYLKGEDRWWNAQLYDSGESGLDIDSCRAVLTDQAIDSTARAALSEHPSFSLAYTNGQRFRYYRLYKHRNDQPGAQRWLLQLSETMVRDISILERDHHDLLHALDKLLPFTGLFDSFKLGALNRIMGMRCTEEVVTYLEKVHQLWSTVLRDMIPPAMLDADTVSKLGLLCPADCAWDATLIEGMLERGEIFSQVADPFIRASLLANLLSCSRIITIRTMVEDSNWLKAAQESLQTLFPRESNCSASYRSHLFKSFRYDSQWFLINYVDLWLFAMRWFPELSRKSSSKGKGKPKEADHADVSHARVTQLALEAAALGFETDNILKRLTSCSKQPPIDEPGNVVLETSCDWGDFQVNWRSGKPTWQCLEMNRKYLYSNIILRRSPGPRKGYVTSTRIVQDIILSFWSEGIAPLASNTSRKRYQDAVSLLASKHGNARPVTQTWLTELAADLTDPADNMMDITINNQMQHVEMRALMDRLQQESARRQQLEKALSESADVILHSQMLQQLSDRTEELNQAKQATAAIEQERRQERSRWENERARLIGRNQEIQASNTTPLSQTNAMLSIEVDEASLYSRGQSDDDEITLPSKKIRHQTRLISEPIDIAQQSLHHAFQTTSEGNAEVDSAGQMSDPQALVRHHQVQSSQEQRVHFVSPTHVDTRSSRPEEEAMLKSRRMTTFDVADKSDDDLPAITGGRAQRDQESIQRTQGEALQVAFHAAVNPGASSPSRATRVRKQPTLGHSHRAQSIIDGRVQKPEQWKDTMQKRKQVAQLKEALRRKRRSSL